MFYNDPTEGSAVYCRVYVHGAMPGAKHTHARKYKYAHTHVKTSTHTYTHTHTHTHTGEGRSASGPKLEALNPPAFPVTTSKDLGRARLPLPLQTTAAAAAAVLKTGTACLDALTQVCIHNYFDSTRRV